MKSLLFLIIGLSGFVIHANDNNPIPAKKAFTTGEHLKYRVHYGLINAGEAELMVSEKVDTILNRPTMHLIATGQSVGAFNWFYKVEDRYESYIDQEYLTPWFFKRDVYEGGYTINRKVVFNQHQNKAKVDNKEYAVPERCQDLVSAFYYARTMDLQHFEIGDTVTINTFFDYEVYPLTIRFLGKEEVDTDLGTVACLKFRPMIQKGRVFKDQEDMTLWVSDDANKIPIRLQADLLIGSVKMDITHTENLITPLQFID